MPAITGYAETNSINLAAVLLRIVAPYVSLYFKLLRHFTLGMVSQRCCLGHTLPEVSFCHRQQSNLLLQIASCSVHYSGALLLEARDGEFLDEHLCSSSIAASSQTQQPQPTADNHFTTGNEAADAAQGNEHAADTYDGYDDGGGCDDGFAGDDYMQEDAAQGLQGLQSLQLWLVYVYSTNKQACWKQSVAAFFGYCQQELLLGI